MGRRPPVTSRSKTAATPGARRPTSRGNRRTRGGAGRHNLGRVGFDNPTAKVRVCLGCNRPFKSRGPWNRFCGRCHQHQEEEEHDNTRTFHVPREWPAGVLGDDF